MRLTSYSLHTVHIHSVSLKVLIPFLTNEQTAVGVFLWLFGGRGKRLYKVMCYKDFCSYFPTHPPDTFCGEIHPHLLGKFLIDSLT